MDEKQVREGIKSFITDRGPKDELRKKLLSQRTLTSEEFTCEVLLAAGLGNSENTALDLAIDLLAEYWREYRPPIGIFEETSADEKYVLAGAAFRSLLPWHVVEALIHILDEKNVKEAKDNYWSDFTDDWKWKEF